MASESKLEQLFSEWALSFAIRPEREYRFHPSRKWRFDFAWPQSMVAVELEGGVWTMGRHLRGSGFINDCDKYNAAAELGWIVLRYTTQHLQDMTTVICQVSRVLGKRK